MTHDEKQKLLFDELLEKIRVYMEKCTLLYKDAENRTQIMWEVNRTRKAMMATEQSLYDFNNDFSKTDVLPNEPFTEVV